MNMDSSKSLEHSGPRYTDVVNENVKEKKKKSVTIVVFLSLILSKRPSSCIILSPFHLGTLG
jgi:hypothetical protein